MHHAGALNQNSERSHFDRRRAGCRGTSILAPLIVAARALHWCPSYSTKTLARLKRRLIVNGRKVELVRFKAEEPTITHNVWSEDGNKSDQRAER